MIILLFRRAYVDVESYTNTKPPYSPYEFKDFANLFTSDFVAKFSLF